MQAIDMTALPTRVDRKAGADLVTKHFFPIAARTIERWPVPSRFIAKRAIYETSELLAYAQELFDAAPALGRKASNHRQGAC